MSWEVPLDWLLQHGWKILLVAGICAVVYFILRHTIPRLLSRTVPVRMKGVAESEIQERVETLSRALTGISLGVITIIGVFTILSEVGVNMGAALAGLGVIGIAVALGTQSLIKDLLAGFFILIENQFTIGDWVKIGGVEGLVEEINLRRTVLRAFDGSVHSVPNSEVRIATNFTKDWSRVNMSISVGYGEDMDYVFQVINRVGNEMSKESYWKPLIITPPQALRIDEFGDSGINIRILGDTHAMRQWEVMGELRKRLKKTFDAEGIEIPWPHIKLYYGNTPSGQPVEMEPPKVRVVTTPEVAEQPHIEVIGDSGGEGQ